MILGFIVGKFRCRDAFCQGMSLGFGDCLVKCYMLAPATAGAYG